MDAAEAAIKGKVITEDTVETIPENVNNACIDECVCMQSVKRFFTDDAWRTVEAIMMIKQERCSYFCKICELEIRAETNMKFVTGFEKSHLPRTIINL